MTSISSNHEQILITTHCKHDSNSDSLVASRVLSLIPGRNRSMMRRTSSQAPVIQTFRRTVTTYGPNAADLISTFVKGCQSVIPTCYPSEKVARSLQTPDGLQLY